jgi:hypothetical protein
VAAVVVVGVEPGDVSVASFGVVAVGAGVGPFVGEGAVEAFYFPLVWGR